MCQDTSELFARRLVRRPYGPRFRTSPSGSPAGRRIRPCPTTGASRNPARSSAPQLRPRAVCRQPGSTPRYGRAPTNRGIFASDQGACNLPPGRLADGRSRRWISHKTLDYLQTRSSESSATVPTATPAPDQPNQVLLVTTGNNATGEGRDEQKGY